MKQKHSFEERFIDSCILVMVAILAGFAFVAVLQEYYEPRKEGQHVSPPS